MTARRPIDPREFVRMCVDLPHHPKIIGMADPAAAWGYAAAVMYVGRNFTDGWLTIHTIAHEAGISVQKARKLVAVGLVHENGHTCQKCPEVPKGKAYLHDYLDHNRSRDEADEQRRSKAEAGRRGAAKRWGNQRGTGPKTPPKADSNRHSSTHDTSDSNNMAEEEEERTTHLPEPPYIPNARDETAPPRPTGPGITGTHSARAYHLVDDTIGRHQPSGIRTALAIEAATLLAELPEHIVAEALRRWNTRTGIGPRILPTLTADIIKEAAGHGPSAAGTSPRAPARGTGSKRTDKALAFLADDDPILESGGELRLIEGGRSA